MDGGTPDKTRSKEFLQFGQLTIGWKDMPDGSRLIVPIVPTERADVFMDPPDLELDNVVSMSTTTERRPPLRAPKTGAVNVDKKAAK